MARSVIDPITRIEGHLRVEMEVDSHGVVSDAWVSGGCFRGMELIVKDRAPEDAAHIVQRICGVCPVSHTSCSSIAAEQAYGITIPNNARIIRNLIEGGQFLHSHILWFYNLAALDFVNPLNALSADVAGTYDLALEAGLSTATDFKALKERLAAFAANGQLSIFSGNWFDADGGTAYKLPPEADLICTAHYLEALKMQARASEICGLLGGKMPHVMTIVPGGTPFVPTAQKLDDLKYMVDEVAAWVEKTMIPDTMVIGSVYSDAFGFGKGVGRYVSWGVFERAFDENTSYIDRMKNRYMPMGVLDDSLRVSDVDESMITEYMGHSWYKGDETHTAPYYITEPEYTEYYKSGTMTRQGIRDIGTVNDKYTWVKCPQYGGKPYEAGSLSRILAAYVRGNSFIRTEINKMLVGFGAGSGNISALQNTLGRIASRQVEAYYISKLMQEWVAELIEAVKGGDSSYFVAPKNLTGVGSGFWEAPRGALYHNETVVNGKIEGYHIIIPSTWNLAPHNKDGEYGPMEKALIGVPVGTIEKPINALRTAHSFDPCVACAVHISQPSTGKHFETVTNPWGVK
ncbi:MAG: nickel-dependent hydrogenase large subunit [Eggerthellaceae bacterium]|nr:nickel-dependent hydrogenase large subunit [Eggerthellaceae bacterium]